MSADLKAHEDAEAGEELAAEVRIYLGHGGGIMRLVKALKKYDRIVFGRTDEPKPESACGPGKDRCYVFDPCANHTPRPLGEPKPEQPKPPICGKWLPGEEDAENPMFYCTQQPGHASECAMGLTVEQPKPDAGPCRMCRGTGGVTPMQSMNDEEPFKCPRCNGTGREPEQGER